MIHRHLPGTTRTDDGDPPDLLALARLLQVELPLLAAIDGLLLLAGSMAALALVALGLAGPVVAAVVLGPAWLVATAACLGALAGDPPGIRDLPRLLQRYVRIGGATALPLGLVASALVGTLGLMAAGPGRGWMAIPIALDVLALVVLGFGGVHVFMLAAMTDLGPRACWLAAVSLAGRNLVPSGGVLALMVRLALSVAAWGPWLASLLIGPACLLATATARRTTLGGGR
jgi:hypothetical protein